MRYFLRNAILAIPFLSSVSTFGSGPPDTAIGRPVALAEADSMPVAADSAQGASRDSSTGYREAAANGIKAMRAGQSDSALDLFLEAHRLGMSKDSLYFFLAEAAFTHSAYDTALAFNLAIATPGKGALRESVLDQRFRIYGKAGLQADAAAVADSMLVKPSRPSRRGHEFNLRFSSGYFRADDYPATLYPLGLDRGDARTEGTQFRNQAQLLWPLFTTGKTPWSGGVEYDLIKSYAKDSLDYRAGLTLKEDDLLIDSLSLSVTAEVGNVTGAGLVSSYKFEASFLSFSGEGITMIQGGAESEWTDAWENRFTGFWASFYQDRSLATGRGFNYSLSVSGIVVDPIRESTAQDVIYVDDVGKPRPVHFSDSTFQDTLAANSRGTYLQYTSNKGTGAFATVSPQGFVTALPNLGYSFPLPFSLSGEIGAHYVFTVFPQPYAWSQAPLPAGSAAGAGAVTRFRGLALNRADGRRYAAELAVLATGGFSEAYGLSPLRRVERIRVDQQAGADISLRRRLGRWGTITLDGAVKRNWSTVAVIAPIWIPEWDMGAAMKWSKGWKW